MKNFLTPRFTEPLAAALMGAGFFIFVSVLAGSPFYRDAEEALWARFQGNATVSPAQAVLLKGKGHENLSLAQRRLSLAHDLDLLSGGAPRAIVLEAWLDEASQAESEELLADLLDSAKTLPQKSAKSLQATVAGLKSRLNADATLALAIAHAGNIVLPVAAEPAPAMSPVSGTVWEKAHPYEVVVRGKGARRLDSAWRLVRAPYASFRDACTGLALLAPPMLDSPDGPLEIQSIFQVRGRWVNGVGFEAARAAMQLPAKGVHFLWREGRLSAVEMRGARFPITPRGSFCLPSVRDRAQVDELSVESLDAAPLLKSIQGKVVFYQPWPGLLTGEAAFVQQRELCAGLLSGHIQAQAEASSDFWLALSIGLLSALAVALAHGLWAWLIPPFFAAVEFWRFIQIQAGLASPLALLLAGLLFGAGIRMLASKRRHESRRLWLRGHVAPGAQPGWEKLLPDPGNGHTVEGVYIALRSEAKIAASAWSSWAGRFEAFSEGMDGKEHGFLIALERGQKFPLAAVDELRRLLPETRIAAVRGVLALSAEKVFDSVRWSLAGEPKNGTLAMLEMARPGSLLVTEADYSDFRQNVKIQLMGEMPPGLGLSNVKIFNIIGVF